ncbi:hypothetical protein NUW58_g651 [Xylaria curta]|uniref:Uncharacterized protein n=1 Tax=Xylaria curta TaxID=42375 RepID=A0ACC1PQ97_9PEZI|nr:hypothetical protein NUW58_g651 [Xylaria curta]
MYENTAAVKDTTAIERWRAFSAEGTKVLAVELALRVKYDQLYSLQPLANARQPRPLHFYGPGPDGRVHPHDPPVGTLHFARWRHELAAVEDPDDSGYYHEQNPLMINGQRLRPTYTTQKNQAAREVDYFRWEKVTADSTKDIKAFPGSQTTRAMHDEYLLNEDDFNDPNITKPKVSFCLDNRQHEDPKTIYPLGYKLLKKWSKANGNAAWEEGDCLGADRNNPSALTKHIGWFPKRLRVAKAGIGADPQDAVWNDIFQGNLEAKSSEKFISPKDTWSEDPEKVTTLTSSENSRMKLRIVSFEALKAALPPPNPETLDAREDWLVARAAKKSNHQHNKAQATSHFGNNDLIASFPCRAEVKADGNPYGKPKRAEIEQQIDIESSQGLDTPVMVEQLKNLKISNNSKTTQACQKTLDRGAQPATRDDMNEECEAIEAKLKELVRNPEPGREGKRPIVIYSTFRSKFLGTPVTQVLGYEG